MTWGSTGLPDLGRQNSRFGPRRICWSPGIVWIEGYWKTEDRVLCACLKFRVGNVCQSMTNYPVGYFCVGKRKKWQIWHRECLPSVVTVYLALNTLH